MLTEDVRDRQWSKTLARPSSKAHHNPRDELVGVTCRYSSPYRRGSIQRERRYIYRPATVLDNERHPNQIAGALHQRRSGEEVGNLRNVRHECRSRWTEEIDRNLNYGDRRASSQEVAHDHSQADYDSIVVPKACRPALISTLLDSICACCISSPIEWVIRIAGRLRNENELFRVDIVQTDASQCVDAVDHIWHRPVGQALKCVDVLKVPLLSRHGEGCWCWYVSQCVELRTLDVRKLRCI